MELENQNAEQLPSLEGATPREVADRIVYILSKRKAKDVKLLYVEKQTVLADYFLICEGNTKTQVRSLAAEIERKMTDYKMSPLRMEGYTEGSWVLLDFGSVIVHVFNRDTREFYKLEKLWSDGTEIELNLED